MFEGKQFKRAKEPYRIAGTIANCRSWNVVGVAPSPSRGAIMSPT